MEHLIYLFNRGETATVMNVPVARIQSADIGELSDEIAREIYINLCKRNGVEVDSATIADWTIKQVASDIWNRYSYLFDVAAVIPAEHEAAITELGDELLDRMECGDDSECYEAGAEFADALHELAVVEFEFPDGSEE